MKTEELESVIDITQSFKNKTIFNKIIKKMKLK